MWCKEETLDDGRKLTEVINKEHENVKYLPHEKLPENIIAVADLTEAVKDADIIIFVLPHQYAKKTCEQLKGNVKKDAFALTLTKVRKSKKQTSLVFIILFYLQGFSVDEKTNELLLVSEIITNTLSIPCLSMMGGLLIIHLKSTYFNLFY
jgi:glycerol-3-phosphate dehydrogenase (NAD+)